MMVERRIAEDYAKKVKEHIDKKVGEHGEDWLDSPDGMEAWKELNRANAALSAEGSKVEMGPAR